MTVMTLDPAALPNVGCYIRQAWVPKLISGTGACGLAQPQWGLLRGTAADQRITLLLPETREQFLHCRLWPTVAS